jgi:hypothetical protein
MCACHSGWAENSASGLKARALQNTLGGDADEDGVAMAPMKCDGWSRQRVLGGVRRTFLLSNIDVRHWGRPRECGRRRG